MGKMKPTIIKHFFAPLEILWLGCDSQVILKVIININLVKVSLVKDTIV